MAPLHGALAGVGVGNSVKCCVVDGRYVVEITNGGTEEWHGVVQAGMKLRRDGVIRVLL